MGRRWGCACQTPEMTGDSSRERSAPRFAFSRAIGGRSDRRRGSLETHLRVQTRSRSRAERLRAGDAQRHQHERRERPRRRHRRRHRARQCGGDERIRVVARRNRIVLCPLSKLGTPHGRLAPLPPARGGSESSRLRRARRSRRFPAPWASPISTSPSTRSSTGASPRRRRSRLRRWRRCQCRTPPLQIRTRLPPPGGWTRRTARRRRTRASRGAPRGRRARRSARSAACRSPTARGAEPGARRTTCSTMSGLCRNAGETSC